MSATTVAAEVGSMETNCKKFLKNSGLGLFIELYLYRLKELNLNMFS